MYFLLCHPGYTVLDLQQPGPDIWHFFGFISHLINLFLLKNKVIQKHEGLRSNLQKPYFKTRWQLMSLTPLLLQFMRERQETPWSHWLVNLYVQWVPDKRPCFKTNLTGRTEILCCFLASRVQCDICTLSHLYTTTYTCTYK